MPRYLPEPAYRHGSPALTAVLLINLGTPAAPNTQAVRAYLGRLPGVATIHDLHIWPMSTTETALTCHLVLPAGHPGDGFLVTVAAELHERFRIGHATIQIEVSEETTCVLAPDQVV